MTDDALSRPNRFEIDGAAVAHNIAEIRRLVGARTRLFAALKADAYGFGLGPIADRAVAAGADGISVADLGDAVALRRRGIGVPILTYPGALADAVAVAALEAHDITPTVFDRHTAETYARHATRGLPVMVKVDVGLERLGVPADRAAAFVREISSLPNLDILGLYTHFDVPDGPDAAAYIGWQAARYDRLCATLEADGIALARKMVASSAVLRYAPSLAFDAVDPGHILFGLTPPGPATVEMDLRPAFHALKSRLIQARALDRTEFRDHVPFPIRAKTRIGVMPIGLRDGMARLTCGEVLVRGRRVPIAGPFSLEHTRIDLTDVPEADVGEEVVIVGRQGSGEIGQDEVMAHQGFTVKAELALAVVTSVPRVYL